MRGCDFGSCIDVTDGLGKRNAPAGLQDSVKFANCRTLVGYVGKNRASRHDVRRGIGNADEPFGSALHKCALAADVFPHRDRLGMTQHGRRQVGQHHTQRRSHTIDGSERDQTFTGPDVDERHAGRQLRRVENAIRILLHGRADHTAVLGIVGVPSMQ